jgi:hypothetical protein
MECGIVVVILHLYECDGSETVTANIGFNLAIRTAGCLASLAKRQQSRGSKCPNQKPSLGGKGRKIGLHRSTNVLGESSASARTGWVLMGGRESM